VSLFVLSPKIKDRDEVEVANLAKHKKIFYSEWYRYMYYFILRRITKKKTGHKLTYLFFLQFSNFNAPVISISLVVMLLVISKVYNAILSDVQLSQNGEWSRFVIFRIPTFTKIAEPKSSIPLIVKLVIKRRSHITYNNNLYFFL
jgi:hypothetical protein